jgi:hypothetical protein
MVVDAESYWETNRSKNALGMRSTWATRHAADV